MFIAKTNRKEKELDIKGRIWVMKYSSYLCSISFLIYKFVGKI